MREKRCTKCKYFYRSRAKTKFYDHGKGWSMKSPTLLEGMCNYFCINKWWNVPSLSYFKNSDVCEDFEFKTKELW